ncbi:ribonuclease domain-containing protein [Alienimonas chondri]|uniref:Uncharacterized protein n=1 Tax=Alienimonas chondri TaxID=2681879 RepID=A0ABX1VBK1_9PLAN|nr:ribonuclease domain-containing protein [Alienimonas chondri]NNJ24713.1 hypothetical protein [Alienimonas chondri]
MSPNKSAASPATLDAIRHLARLGVRGWVLIALLLGVVYLADRYLLDSPTPAGPGDTSIVASSVGPEERFDPDETFGEDVGTPSLPSSDPAMPPATDDFGPDPQALTRERTAPTVPAADSTPETPRRTYAVVTVSFRTRAGEATVDLDPNAVLTRVDGNGLVLAERLRGGETLKTNCVDDATVQTAEATRVADVRRPPRCTPIVVDPYVENVTVEDFGQPVPAATEDGVLDLSATLERIALGKKFPHHNDGSTFGNREGRLPRQPNGYYKEFVHPTKGVSGPGPQRLVIGRGGDIWYTPDHYDSFRAVVKP